jgi:tyrosyl-tRNA synthetase
MAAFQRAGHVGVLIIGDYTTRIGDPSGRSSERPILSDDEIDANAQTYLAQAAQIVDTSPERLEVRFNGEWLAKLDFAEVVRLTRTITVARLLERDDFARRMERAQPISALELLYPVMQGYDSVAIEADVELGATDQRFNLLFGRDVQVAYGQQPQSILTMPILPGTDGIRKMSKSYDNWVAITDPSEEMFGKLMSIPDSVMAQYYLLLLGDRLDGDRHPGEAKRELARRITDRFHGQGAGAGAEDRFDRVHVHGETPEQIPVARIAVGGGPVHLPALISAEFELSTSEARRLIRQGAVKLDGEVVDPETLDIGGELLAGRVLAVGKRRHRRLQVADA